MSVLLEHTTVLTTAAIPLVVLCAPAEMAMSWKVMEETALVLMHDYCSVYRSRSISYSLVSANYCHAFYGSVTPISLHLCRHQ